ncbi:hypothetical protein HanRHA438_Chr02g0056761 [Helianthus annuus]|nr:hypothetical protein HanHA300_Chr02g0045331 [Helianthus annuus]KAJ0618066.1 hypothetical protein HanHA89_Chr02g0048971 [Helianthus annuus]KAJ0939056.1 hypothetical protein HanRHA438_Chr02g0056761 [Helianthus annuus]
MKSTKGHQEDDYGAKKIITHLQKMGRIVMLLGGCCDVSCSLLGFTQSNKLRHSWPVSNCVRVKMGSFKNHFKWVRVKTGWLRKGFLCWLVVTAVVSSCQLLWWHQHRLVIKDIHQGH